MSYEGYEAPDPTWINGPDTEKPIDALIDEVWRNAAPELAAEVERLRERIAELEGRNHDLELGLTDPSAYDYELAEAKKRIAELEAERRWISVNEETNE